MEPKVYLHLFYTSPPVDQMGDLVTVHNFHTVHFNIIFQLTQNSDQVTASLTTALLFLSHGSGKDASKLLNTGNDIKVFLRRNYGFLFN
jgi:hypothetical protein